jgi:hypothetical protein
VDPKTLESLFRRGRLSRGQFLQGLIAAGVTASGIEALLGSSAVPALASGPAAHYLVVIVLDAFRPDYMDLTEMPALRALMSQGVSYDGAWVGQLESVTPVSHTSLSTGALPRRTGIVGFEWRDPVKKKEDYDGWPQGVLQGDLERDIRQSHTTSIPMAIKAANPKAKVVSLSSEKVYAADGMGGPAADYILYHAYGRGNKTLYPTAVPGHVPPKAFFNQPLLNHLTLPMHNVTDWDWLSGKLALASFNSFHPTALMVNLPGADAYGHPYGPSVPSIMRQVAVGLDRNIARMVDVYKAAGIYGQTLFVVLSDHGMVQNSRAVDVTVVKRLTRAVGGDYFFHWGGTGAHLWIHNWWRARAVAESLLTAPGVVASYYKVNQKGKHQYLPAPGQHIDPALDAANQFLLSTYVGPRAPDVVIPFRENTIGRIHKFAHGDHGGLNWGSQNVLLALRGPGVSVNKVSHYPARIVDIAPTVLELLGLPPAQMDGVVLADALTSATADQVAAQSALEGPLTAYRTALMAQSQDNVEEDARLGIRPPPAQT